MTTTTAAPPGTRPWQIDSSHTDAQFSVRHLMISTVRGRFGETRGTVVYDPSDPSSLDLRVTIPVASIQTHDEQRDNHLRSPDFFDAASFPEITFVGRRIEGDFEGRFKLRGDLTIRGTTREITFDVTNEGIGGDPWGNERMGFSASGKINRFDFGLRWSAALETGGMVVGDEVKLTVNLEVMRPKA
jgi:polyisoprenoid-binding protein YceI